MSFDECPLDVKQLIARFLPITSLGSFALSCKSANQAVLFHWRDRIPPVALAALQSIMQDDEKFAANVNSQHQICREFGIALESPLVAAKHATAPQHRQTDVRVFVTLRVNDVVFREELNTTASMDAWSVACKLVVANPANINLVPQSNIRTVGTATLSATITLAPTGHPSHSFELAGDRNSGQFLPSPYPSLPHRLGVSLVELQPSPPTNAILHVLFYGSEDQIVAVGLTLRVVSHQQPHPPMLRSLAIKLLHHRLVQAAITARVGSTAPSAPKCILVLTIPNHEFALGAIGHFSEKEASLIGKPHDIQDMHPHRDGSFPEQFDSVVASVIMLAQSNQRMFSKKMLLSKPRRVARFALVTGATTVEATLLEYNGSKFAWGFVFGRVSLSILVAQEQQGQWKLIQFWVTVSARSQSPELRRWWILSEPAEVMGVLSAETIREA